MSDAIPQEIPAENGSLTAAPLWLIHRMEAFAADAAAYLAGSGDLVPRSRGDALEIRRQSGN